MTTLNRTGVLSTPMFEFAGGAPHVWSELPQPGTALLRRKYDHSGTLPKSRGLGLNTDANGQNGESQIYSDADYLGGVVGSGFTWGPSSVTLNATPITDAAKAAVAKCASDPLKFRSAMVSSDGARGFFRYGLFEIRCRQPVQALGDWPAFWLMGAHGCPHQEFDVFERLGGEGDAIHSTVTTRLDQWGGMLPADVSKTAQLVVPAKEFHTYSGLWTPTLCQVYADDALLWSIPNPGLHNPMMMIADLSMDGAWNKQRGFVADPSATSSLEIAFIRAWQLR